MRYFTCDRCGQPIDPQGRRFTAQVIQREPTPGCRWEPADLCIACAGALFRWLETPASKSETVEHLRARLDAKLWDAALADQRQRN